MRNLFKFIAIALLATCCSNAYAVTEAEMEQARTTAALWYLRYMNNGSEYLEHLSPKTMSELEAGLKDKEKENLPAFKKVSVPSDYASWDKEKLVEYWSSTAFSNLPEEGRKARARVKSKLSEMKVTPPAKIEEQPEQKPEEEQKKPETAETPTPAPQNDPLSLVQDGSGAVPESDVAKADEELVSEEKEPAEGGSSTGIYVTILIVLVIAVICIIVYAINTMKKSRTEATKTSTDNEAQRRKFVAAIADKDETIAAMEHEIDALNQEIERLNRQLQMQQTRRTTADNTYHARSISPQNPRTIYLAQANQRGVFVRADANYNMGNSIFKLVTTDGVSGTYSVIDDPVVYDLALTVPADYLMPACLGDNLQLAKGMHEIVTDTPGTAIFEEGKWRVLRKARIHYER